MLQIDILTLFPDMFRGFLGESIINRATKKGIAQIGIHQLREYSALPRGQVDDYPYGGGAGMVLMAEPLVNAIESLSKQGNYDEVIYLTPDGHQFDQPMANALSLKARILLICGRYKGIDQRVRDGWVTREVSIGPYVISGGELAAAVLADGLIRLLPGALGDETSALTDSFQDGMMDAPQYTRPAEFRGQAVPPVLLGGDHARIAEWRHQQSLSKSADDAPG